MIERRPSYSCFRLNDRVPATAIEIRLPSRAADALASLLPVLGCGEEAAGLAFEQLGGDSLPDTDASQTLCQIAREEHVHDGLIRSLAASLPPTVDRASLLAATRRFHLALGRGDRTARLARIATLDSAVCMILSRLLRPGTPLSRDRAIATILRGIAQDEARHVRVTRQLALAREEADELRRIAAPVRERLALLLDRASDAFEVLAFDPLWIRKDLARLPAGLFPR